MTTLPTLRPQEASKAGYKPITDSVVVDGDIYKSMAAGMAGVDACWISEGPYRAKLARKKTKSCWSAKTHGATSISHERP